MGIFSVNSNLSTQHREELSIREQQIFNELRNRDNEFFTKQRLEMYAALERNEEVASYFNGELRKEERLDIEDEIVKIERALNPSRCDFDIYKTLLAVTL